MHQLSSAGLPSPQCIANHQPPEMLSYTAKGDSVVTHKSKNLKFSDFTSKIEGQDLGEMRQIWKDTATSEMRMNLMSTLQSKNLGFREIENFGLGLKYNFKSEKLKEQKDRPIEGVIRAAMKLKMQDEKYHHR